MDPCSTTGWGHPAAPAARVRLTQLKFSAVPSHQPLGMNRRDDCAQGPGLGVRKAVVGTDPFTGTITFLLHRFSIAGSWAPVAAGGPARRQGAAIALAARRGPGLAAAAIDQAGTPP